MDSDSDSFFIDNVKAEKAHAMMRYQRFRRTADLLRYFFEVCVVFTLFLWLSPRLPVTFTLFSNYLRHISVLLKSPRFMFIIGNAIILTLFVKSGQVSGDSSPSSDLYDEFYKNSSKMDKIRHETQDISPPVPETEPLQEVAVSVTVTETIPPVVVYEDKQVLSEKKQEPDATVTPKKYERSQSEKMKQVEKPKKELRRYKTGRSRAEEMSNEEFNRTIEEFIAKQVKFIREESMAIVAQS